MMRGCRAAIVCVAMGLGLAPGLALAEPVKVVVTIAPIHSLVAGVMAGAGAPRLLIRGGGSPHSYAVRPSEARALQDAQVVVRVSKMLETFLNRPIAALADEARILTLDEVPGMILHDVREGGVWDAHDHGREAGDAREGHGHDGDARAHDNDDQEHHHRYSTHDAHLWLDPTNSKVAVNAIAAALSEANPANADIYRANAQDMHARLEALHAALSEATAPLAARPYVVFHDAYQYFERRYGLTPAGAVSLSPERQPGARRLSQLRERIGELGATCVFAEPQFEPRLVHTVIEGTQAWAGVLDPLAADLEPGPDLYFEMMRGLARSLTQCLAE